MPESDWPRIENARRKVVSTWRASRRWARRLGTVLRKWIRWPFDHLVQLVALPLLVALGILLGKRIQAQMAPGAPDVSLKDLVLLGLVVGLAVLAQAGHRLLHRLKKVGPVEFLDQQYERIVPELAGIEWSGNVDTIEPLSSKTLWEYEKAESFVTHLEGSGLDESGLARSGKLHSLLFKLTKIAMKERHWARLVDRAELLLRITDGKFETAKTHYRCGTGYRELATEEARKAEKEKPSEKAQDHRHNAKELFLKAQEHLWRAVKADPHFSVAHWTLAIVQFRLQEYNPAIENNKKSIHINSRFAKAKYNLAVCHLKLGQKEDASKAILSIDPGDAEAQWVGEFGPTDNDLLPLLEEPGLGEEIRNYLKALSSKPDGSS